MPRCANCGCTDPTQFQLKYNLVVRRPGPDCGAVHQVYISYCNDCHNAKNKAWSKANPDRVRAIARRTYAKHRDAHLAYYRRYNAAHRQQRLAYAKAYYQRKKAEKQKFDSICSSLTINNNCKKS